MWRIDVMIYSPHVDAANKSFITLHGALCSLRA